MLATPFVIRFVQSRAYTRIWEFHPAVGGGYIYLFFASICHWRARQDKLFVVWREGKDILFASKQTCREHITHNQKGYFLWEPQEAQLLRFPPFVFHFSCAPHCVWWGGMQITLIVFAEENKLLQPTVTLMRSRDASLAVGQVKKLFMHNFYERVQAALFILNQCYTHVRCLRLRFIGRINEVPLSRQPWLVTWHWAEDKKERKIQGKKGQQTR